MSIFKIHRAVVNRAIFVFLIAKFLLFQRK